VKRIIKKIGLGVFLLIPLISQAGDKMQTFYDFNATNIIGENISMSNYKGKVVLVVNVASKCGFTPQYEGLEKLYKAHHDQGLEILAFPCNQFKEQESGTNQEIKSFCTTNYGVTFPLFDKIEVNGENTHPLYTFLKKEATGFMWTQSIKWNFTKFLIDRDGNVITRYGSATKPESIEEDISRLLREFVVR
jgi:glutathione peroxidase